MAGQLLLKKSSVLIVGAGGLGCPSSLYLAASGVGHIGIVDYDEVEVNNLHRQILHTTVGVGVRKVDSAATFIKNLNPHIKVTSYPILLNNTNSFDIMSNYDVIIDATDNVPTRYLLNDTCVRLSKPLVSGSALQMEGQLTIYNYKNGPCYRCIFPIPPPSETVTNCGDGGVLGMIPGVIGLLQALETVKIILNQDTIQGYLLLFNGCDTTFKKIKLRPRNPACEICGQSSNRLSKPLNQFDYEEFCGSKSCDKSPNLKLLPEGKRITATKYNSIKDEPHVLVDVRYEQEFGICKLENSLNIPITKINSKECIEKIEEEIAKKKDENVSSKFVCFLLIFLENINFKT